jgi:exopolysaccharide production protein ExoQ
MPLWLDMLHPTNLAIIVVLFWMTGPVAPLIPDLDDSLGTMLALPANSLSAPVDVDNQFLRLSWYPVYLIVLLLVHPHWRRIWTVVARNWPLALLLGWTFLSTLWSVSPADTLRRTIALSLSTAFAVYLGSRFDTLQIVKLLAVALTIDMVGSVVCAVAFPSIGISSDTEYAGAWRGVFASKNQMGGIMLIACLAFFILYLAERRRTYLLGLGAGFALLLLSTSKTPLVIMIALVPSLTLTSRFFRDSRGFSLLLALSLTIAALVLLVVSVALEPVLAFFGRDLTFTGRTDIWDLSWQAAQQRYWTGYGYGAFWTGGKAADNIWDVLNWRVPSSHNGGLEIWLALGFVGVMIFAALIVRSFSEIVAQATKCGREECLWRLGYFLIFAIELVTEPNSMEQTSVSWALFVVVISAGARIARRPQRAGTAAERPPPWSPRLLPAAGRVPPRPRLAR